MYEFIPLFYDLYLNKNILFPNLNFKFLGKNGDD